MTDDRAQWVTDYEPCVEDFDAADEVQPKVGAKTTVFRILRLVASLLVILALLFYFVVPFNNIFGSMPFHWRGPGTGLRAIPLAPQRKSSPKQLSLSPRDGSALGYVAAPGLRLRSRSST